MISNPLQIRYNMFSAIKKLNAIFKATEVFERYQRTFWERIKITRAFYSKCEPSDLKGIDLFFEHLDDYFQGKRHYPDTLCVYVGARAHLKFAINARNESIGFYDVPFDSFIKMHRHMRTCLRNERMVELYLFVNKVLEIKNV